MKKEKELDLLLDLAKLLKKYGPETFDSLAELISSQAITQQLSLIMTQYSKTYRSSSKKGRMKKRKGKVPIPRSLTNIESVDPEKYFLLMKFYTDLNKKVALPTLRDIKEFALECRLPEVRAKSRKLAISPLFSSLIELPIEELKSKIELIKKYDKGDRSLEGWGNIILNKQPRLGEKQ